VKTPEDTEDSDDPEPAAQRDTQIEYSSNKSYSPMYREEREKKNPYMSDCRSVQILSDNLKYLII